MLKNDPDIRYKESKQAVISRLLTFVYCPFAWATGDHECKTRLRLLIYLLPLLLGVSPISHSLEPLDKVVAIVENQVVLESEIKQRISLLKINEPEFKEVSDLRLKILEQLILEKLQNHQW